MSHHGVDEGEASDFGDSVFFKNKTKVGRRSDGYRTFFCSRLLAAAPDKHNNKRDDDDDSSLAAVSYSQNRQQNYVQATASKIGRKTTVPIASKRARFRHLAVVSYSHQATKDDSSTM